MPESVSVNIAGWLGCFVFLLVAYNTWQSIQDRSKSRPPAGELAKAMESISALLDATSRRVTENENKASERRQTIFRELNTLREQFTTADTDIRRELMDKITQLTTADERRTERLHVRIDAVEAELREVPNRVVSLLKLKT